MQDTAIARPMAPADLVPGYRLVQLVGRGGMGEVHQATQLSLGRTVAVKLLRKELAADEQFVGRFEKEGEALAALRHPNIVSVVDRGHTEGAERTWFLVMEFVDGPSLRERMRDPDFDPMTALAAMIQVARAIDYAHHRGIVHRDLKPENILFDEQAGLVPKVSDFGLAGFDERHSNARNLTQTHVSMGTASYMAPEQAVDAKSAGPRADIYSLGVMLYEVLTGELPVGTFELPSKKRPALDARLDPIIARCLKPAQEDRYPTMTALLEELEPIVPMTAAPSRTKVTPVQRLLRRVRTVSVKTLQGAAFGLVVVAGAIVAVTAVRADRAALRRPAGVELTTDTGVQTPLSVRGRVDYATKEVSLGEGPDTVSVIAMGRPAHLEEDALVYEGGDELTVGRAVVDAEVAGAGVVASTIMELEAEPPSRFEPLFRVLRGPRPEPRGALMLLGEHGRYVALVVSASGGEPTLEWALGPDKRGVMQAPVGTSTKAVHVELRVDPEVGELFAVIGEGRDARVVGDGVWLGPNWRTELGQAPRLAVGCLDGRCRFAKVRLTGVEVPAGLTPPGFPPEDVLAAPAEPVSSAQRLQDAPTKRLVKALPKVEVKPPRKGEGKPPVKKKEH